MSYGGCYASVNKSKLNYILDNNESLQNYVDSLPDNESHTVEQYWDGIRVLLMKKCPNILGNDILDVDLGEQCMLIESHEKEEIYNQISSLTYDELKNIMTQDWYINESFYWDNLFKNSHELIDEVLKLVEFFKKELEKTDNVLVFWIT